MKRAAEPSKIARRILARTLPADARGSIPDEMDELFARRATRSGVVRAHIWYLTQIISFALRFTLERARPAYQAQRDQRGKGRSLVFSRLDWKLGGRMLAKHPGMSVISGIALAAAIALGAGAFELIDQELRPTIPLEGGRRLVTLGFWDPTVSREENRMLYDYEIWQQRLKSVEDLAAGRGVQSNLVTDDGRAEPVGIAEVTASMFPLTRVTPLLGRALLASDEVPGSPEVAVIGYNLWQNRFAGQRNILGRTIQIGRRKATVVGVMPEGFAFPHSQQVWLPLRVAQRAPLSGPPVEVFGRLASGSSIDNARTEITAVGEGIAAANPVTHGRLQPEVQRFGVDRAGPNRTLMLFLLYGGTLLILTAVCANVATLIFARTALRESEIVVRNALGATRGRVMGQLFVESLVLSLVSAAVGLGAATLVLKFIWHQAVNVRQVPQPFWYNSRLEIETVLYAIGLAIFGAMLMGLLPAIKATGPRLQQHLQALTGGATSMRFGGVWSLIIVLQVAFTVICLPLGIGVTRETLNDHKVRSAFASEGYLTFRAGMDGEHALGEGAQSAEFARDMSTAYEALKRRLLAEPGVGAVTFADRVPGMSHEFNEMEAQRGNEDPVFVNANLDGNVSRSSVDVDFFDVFRAPLLTGRDFQAGDAGSAVKPVLINESLARNIGGNPLGVRLRTMARGDAKPGEWHQVVGVVTNLDMDPTERGEADFMFIPAGPADAYPPVIAIRLTSDAATFTPRLRQIAMQVDPGLRLYDVIPLDEVVRRKDLPNVMATMAATGIAALALMLSAAGLFALMSVAVSRRTREVGIRLALGATSANVLGALFGRSAAQVGTGILIGNAAVFVLVWVMTSEFQLSIAKPMLLVSAIMAFVGVAACAIPARRALRIQPTNALKQPG